MTTRQVRLAPDHGSEVLAGLAEVRRELEIREQFPAEVMAEAEASAVRPIDGASRADLTDVPFVTIDPAGSMDLDQAVHVSRDGSGFRVRYAIADVAWFVPDGGAIDGEARIRGLTQYAPDGRVPLHPPRLSEGAASLLPAELRPAVVWDLLLDSDGTVTATDVHRALVRSRAQLAYDEVQRAIESGTADDAINALVAVGRLRQEQERARGGVDLPVPEQVVSRSESGWALSFRAPLPIEGWNAQISLMTGMAAAELMLSAGVGVLRTMPPPAESDIARVRRTAAALELDWPADGDYGALIRSADPGQPEHLAFLSMATTLLRGAGYTAFDGAEPELTTHSAVAAPYAHVTAPLRRLVDRFGTEVALAAAAGERPPDWAVAALPLLPDLMAAATRTTRALERESLNLVEAVLLADRVGEMFTASVVDGDPKSGFSIVITEPAVRAKAKGDLTVGTHADVVLTESDPARRLIRFTTPQVDAKP